MATYTPDSLRTLFQSSFNMEQWYSFLQHFFNATELKSTPERINETTSDEGYYLGNIDTTDSYRIGLFQYNIIKGSVANKRVGLRNLVKSFINPTWGVFDAALVVFDSGDHWRLSFICDIKDEATSPKRYTYVFGSNDLLYRTPIERFNLLKTKGISFENLKTAFSVEALSKEFFAKYKWHYERFCQYLYENKCNENIFGKAFATWEDKILRDYVKKMLGRLVFIQYIYQKGWAPNLLESFDSHADLQENFLDAYLEPLFGGILNTAPELRKNEFEKNKHRGWNISLVDEFKNVPYLNGGLFENDLQDPPRSKFPADYFKDLFTFFTQYNFTIDENEPDDSEVGIDPEMLGHIFENLLEDNKDKGAFYTPKEIVQYMCRQSVIQYLKTHEPSDQYADAIEQLINDGVVNAILQNKSVAARFIQLLKEVKVCDPAIGSGAFPMGILYVLYHAIHHLHSHAEPHGNFDSTQTKRDIIQNNIFGVDIEQGAVDIARLRFWLALVVDADEPQPLPNLDYKITCGNSLLSRYPIDVPIKNVFVKYNKEKKENEKMTLAKYKELVSDYTNTSNHQTKELFRKTIEDIKSAFKTELNYRLGEKLSNLRGKIIALDSPRLFGEPTKAEKAELKKLQEKLNILEKEKEDIQTNKLYVDAFEWRFEFPQLLDEKGKFIGFDIVIGNPPYLRIQGIRDTNPAFAEELVKKYHSATGSFDLYAAFAERGLQVIRQSGIVNYIMPDKWTNAAFGKGLREVVSEQRAAHKIISFGAYQVFNASTYTALQWFKPNSEYLEYYQLDRNLETNQELDIYLKSIKDDNTSIIDAKKLDKNSWVLTVGATSTILQKLESHPRRIADIFDKIFQGLATSKDDVYFLYNCVENDKNIIGYSKQLERNIEIEKGLVKPLLKGEDVHRYDNIKTNRYVIFPYKLNNGKAVLYSEKELSVLFPNGYSYLKECEDILRNREKGRFNIDGEWFQYGRKQGILSAEKEKLVAPDISMGGNFAYDAEGKFYQTTTIYGYIKKSDISESYKFWMALLNSHLCWWFLTNTGTTLANGFFRFKPDYIKPFPVPQDIPQKMEEAIVRIVDDILMQKKDNHQVDTKSLEREIDAMIYKLYELTEEEIKIVEQSI